MTADFQEIRESIKTYLKTQSQFNAYDFDGSTMAILIDILATNAFQQNVNANMVFGDTFLDSAIQRASVVSRAKELDYLPRSMTAASANINLTFIVSGNPSEYILPKNTRFTAAVNGITYTFVTTEDITFTNSADTFSKTINISQGILNTFSYTIDVNDASQVVFVPSQNVDISTLAVSKKNASSDSTYTDMIYARDVSLSEITSTADVYRLCENINGYYELIFGDGVIGHGVYNDNVIKLDYLITNGPAANGAKTFALASTLSGVSGMTITTIDSASGGANRETVDSIKYLAPFYYAAQGRAVTENDYAVLFKNSYGGIDDLTVWGGQKNDPPYYGKVFVAIKPTTGDTLSATQKQAIVDDAVAKYNIVTVTPEIVDPDYIYVSVNTNVTYNSRLFNRTTNQSLQSDVSTAITNFFGLEVNKFGKPLYYSKLAATIDNVSPIIKNSITNLILERRKPIVAGTATQYKFNFNNSIAPASLASNQIVVGGDNWYLKDIPNVDNPHVSGAIAVYKIVANNPVYYSENVGTVTYNTGEVIIDNLKIQDIVDDPIYKKLVISIAQGDFVDATNPQLITSDRNVYSNNREDLIVLKDGGITVTLTADGSN